MEADISAPGRLEIVRQFINTKDVESGSDPLTAPRGLAEWLLDAGLLEESAEGSESELRRGVEVRESLRKLAASNHGTPLDPGSLVVLNQAADAAGLHLSFNLEGAAIEASTSGVLGGLGRLLSFVADAMNDGTWSRLKVCMNDECQWAFYDHARNRSGKWCDMSVCGNRMKARAYRARRTGGSGE